MAGLSDGTCSYVAVVFVFSGLLECIMIYRPNTARACVKTLGIIEVGGDGFDSNRKFPADGKLDGFR
jgi:hypothetical protein